MAKITGNGLTAKFGPLGDLLFTIAVTSISLDSAERPAIDITAASDSQRKAVPGLRGVPTGSVTGILEQAAADVPDQVQAIEAQLTSCPAIACAITAKFGCEVGETAPLVNSDIYVTGFNIEASIDEAVSITVNFMLSSNTFVGPEVTP